MSQKAQFPDPDILTWEDLQVVQEAVFGQTSQLVPQLSQVGGVLAVLIHFPADVLQGTQLFVPSFAGTWPEAQVVQAVALEHASQFVPQESQVLGLLAVLTNFLFEVSQRTQLFVPSFAGTWPEAQVVQAVALEHALQLVPHESHVCGLFAVLTNFLLEGSQ